VKCLSFFDAAFDPQLVDALFLPIRRQTHAIGLTVAVEEATVISTVKAAAREISHRFRTAMEARRS
jgi:hypothetical protein